MVIVLSSACKPTMWICYTCGTGFGASTCQHESQEVYVTPLAINGMTILQQLSFYRLVYHKMDDCFCDSDVRCCNALVEPFQTMFGIDVTDTLPCGQRIVLPENTLATQYK